MDAKNIMIVVGEVVGEFCEFRLYLVDVYLRDFDWYKPVVVVVVLGLCFGAYRGVRDVGVIGFVGGVLGGSWKVLCVVQDWG